MSKYAFIFLLFASGLTFTTTTACKAKYGCPSNEQVQPKTNKRGELKAGKNKNRSELFDKKTRKRMGHK